MWVTVLGLPDSLYWDSCPREIDACFVEHYRSEDAQNARAGTIAASIFNSRPIDAKQKKKRKWLDWTNFFKPMTSQRKRKSGENQIEQAKRAWEQAYEALHGPVSK